eukprot:COSAG01_NODE_58_length_30193_cov_12.302020_11_plen_158_part_00
MTWPCFHAALDNETIASASTGMRHSQEKQVTAGRGILCRYPEYQHPAAVSPGHEATWVPPGSDGRPCARTTWRVMLNGHFNCRCEPFAKIALLEPLPFPKKCFCKFLCLVLQLLVGGDVQQFTTNDNSVTRYGSEACKVVTGREACVQAEEDQVVLY